MANQPTPHPVRRLPSERNALIGPTSAARWLLVAILLAGVYFFYGFVVPILAATVIGIASWPLYRRILSLTKGNRTVGATVAIIFVVFFIVTPITLAGLYAVNEIKHWGAWALKANEIGAPVPDWIIQIPFAGPWLAGHWDQYVGHPGSLGEVVQLVSGANIGTIYRGILVIGSSAFHGILTLLFMLISLFFVYRDGERIVAQVDTVGERILPSRWTRVSRLVPMTISSTVTGMTMIAVGEGIVLGCAYWIAGVSSPVTFGIITGFMALIPGGAPLCFTLMSIYLAAKGSLIAGLGLLAWGTLELFIVDKTLRPRLVGGPIKLPFLPTFFGLVGGVKTMGLLGLFVGPVIMAILVTIWREWLIEAQDAKNESRA
ncbi:AI-2E family transporter [Allorhizobium sp. BGMRC 0089]|uniref:AI-2E family transporter n=1 Tax=Allorhizobium sonneratiae TaxID=2934936 RepID=UPI0020340AB3|nr:AI-2E family transporter [Allorhizobium sonneratiae]MCM2293464.1 AI-2E family transporter [Allorhizobium sonneratiae]